MSSRGTLLAMLSGLATSVATALLFARRPAPGLASATQPASGRSSGQRADIRGGEPGSGGYYGTWPKGTPDAAVAEHIEFQYAGMDHQSDTALSGMWLFLATELLFFGGLFLLYMIYRSQYPHAFALASQHTEVVIGTVNTMLLLSSSAVFAWGLGQARLGDNRGLFRACVIVVILGTAFLLLKGWEWKDDLDKHLFPGPGFALTSAGIGAQLFWTFYWVATSLHGIHMVVGVGLVLWLAWTTHQQRYSKGYFTPVEVIGLYWSFVDMIWLSLFPMIYLIGGAT